MSVDSALLGGRYRLEGLIGRGGMASVWRATDTVLERTVAVKRLHARLHDDPELAERFRREGHAVARLSHPNLVRLLDQGQEGDEPFLVFELVEGRDLKTMIRRDGRIPVGEAVSICTQVARALASAHAAGVVHRDIKSHNILVTEAGVAKLTDIGVARIIESDETNLTKTGIVMGSSDYLAPEQAEGRQVDSRGDIYSLGVVLYESITGQLPFSGENPVAVATKHVYEPPPDPRSIAPHIPKTTAAACLRAMAKRPEERFATAGAFADALAGEGDDEEIVGLIDATTGRMPAVRPPRRGRAGWRIGAAVAVAGVAGFGVWQSGVFGGGAESSGASGVALVATSIEALDPFGTGGEHDAQAGNAIDRDVATAWTTEQYGSADMGKAGVGLVVHLSTPTRLTRVRLTSATAGGNVRILGEGADVASRPLLGGDVPLASTPVDIPIRSSAVVSEFVVWITSLPQSLGTQKNPFQAAIGEVEATGVANT